MCHSVIQKKLQLSHCSPLQLVVLASILWFISFVGSSWEECKKPWVPCQRKNCCNSVILYFCFECQVCSDCTPAYINPTHSTVPCAVVQTPATTWILCPRIQDKTLDVSPTFPSVCQLMKITWALQKESSTFWGWATFWLCLGLIFLNVAIVSKCTTVCVCISNV